MAKIADVAELIMGQSPPSSTYNEDEVGLAFFQGKSDFGFRHPTPRLYCSEPLKVAKPRDILMSVRAPVGPTNIADQECCIGRGLAAIRARAIDGDFLFYNIRYIEKYIASLGTGSTFHAINKTQLGSIEVNEHDFALSEQKKIAGVLGVVQQAIEQQEQLLQRTTELKKTLLHKLFTEGLPSSAGKRGEPQKQTEIGPVPESWEITTLSNLFEIKHGFAFAGEHFAPQGRYVLLTPGHFFEEGGFRNQEDKTKYYLGEFPRGYILRKGDLLVAMTEQKSGLIGSAIIVPESDKYLHNQRLGLIQNLNEQRLDKLFLFYFFNTPEVRKQISLTSSGSKVRHTSPGKIRELSIALPPIEDQKQLANMLKTVDAKIDIIKSKKEALTDLFRTMLQQLMTAQIRVNELDIAMMRDLDNMAATNA